MYTHIRNPIQGNGQAMSDPHCTPEYNFEAHATQLMGAD